MDIRYMGLRESVECLLGQEQRLNQVSNNLANVDSPGYKKEVVAFREALITARNGHQRLATTMTVATDQRQAATEMTGNPLDLAITGDGYFKIQTADGVRYTRAGSFQTNSEGQLVTPDGYQVLGDNGPITINGGRQVTVSQDGVVSVDGVESGRLAIVTVSNPTALDKEGRNTFRLNAAVGQETRSAGFSVQQGFIEKSNVNTIDEMTAMMELLRLYESQQKSIRIIDDIDSQATARVGKLTP